VQKDNFFTNTNTFYSQMAVACSKIEEFQKHTTPGGSIPDEKKAEYKKAVCFFRFALASLIRHLDEKNDKTEEEKMDLQYYLNLFSDLPDDNTENEMCISKELNSETSVNQDDDKTGRKCMGVSTPQK
jgi:hypothetical protein